MRNGILAAGNFIMDHVKLIDGWPEQDMLASIVSETSCNGGGPYNVLKDLSAMGAPFPLEAAGLIGSDANGDWILRDCAEAGIGTAQLRQTGEAPTSYTDAMTVASTGRRTFFHQRGANALFSDVDFSKTSARHLHLGYLMLLDAMDVLDGGRTRASLLLEQAQQAGMSTSVDLVSTPHPQYREIVESALPFTDLLIVNEIEAGKAAGMNLRPDGHIHTELSMEAMRHLLDRGVCQQVVIHYAEGACLADKSGHVAFVDSLRLPKGFIAGATGAGDAFAAGFLYAWHEGWEDKSLPLGVCAAAACLSHPTPSGGLRPVEECWKLLENHGCASQ